MNRQASADHATSSLAIRLLLLSQTQLAFSTCTTGPLHICTLSGTAPLHPSSSCLTPFHCLQDRFVLSWLLWGPSHLIMASFLWLGVGGSLSPHTDPT